MTTTVKKTDTITVPVMVFLAKMLVRVGKIIIFTTTFLLTVVNIFAEVLNIPFKLFSLWNKGYSVRPIFILNGIGGKNRKQRLGGSAFAYDFKAPGSHYRVFIHYSVWYGGFVVGEPISYAGHFLNYDDYKVNDPVVVIKTLWPTLFDLRKAYKEAIKNSKATIKKDTLEKDKNDSFLLILEKLNEAKDGLYITIRDYGDPRMASCQPYIISECEVRPENNPNSSPPLNFGVVSYREFASKVVENGYPWVVDDEPYCC